MPVPPELISHPGDTVGTAPQRVDEAPQKVDDLDPRLAALRQEIVARNRRIVLPKITHPTREESPAKTGERILKLVVTLPFFTTGLIVSTEFGKKHENIVLWLKVVEALTPVFPHGLKLVVLRNLDKKFNQKVFEDSNFPLIVIADWNERRIENSIVYQLLCWTGLIDAYLHFLEEGEPIDLDDELNKSDDHPNALMAYFKSVLAKHPMLENFLTDDLARYQQYFNRPWPILTRVKRPEKMKPAIRRTIKILEGLDWVEAVYWNGGGLPSLLPNDAHLIVHLSAEMIDQIGIEQLYIHLVYAKKQLRKTLNRVASQRNRHDAFATHRIMIMMATPNLDQDKLLIQIKQQLVALIQRENFTVIDKNDQKMIFQMLDNFPSLENVNGQCPPFLERLLKIWDKVDPPPAPQKNPAKRLELDQSGTRKKSERLPHHRNKHRPDANGHNRQNGANNGPKGNGRRK